MDDYCCIIEKDVGVVKSLPERIIVYFGELKVRNNTLLFLIHLSVNFAT